MDNKVFFEQLHIRGLFVRISQSQVDGLNTILGILDRRGLDNLGFRSYILATVYHETSCTMLPIREYGLGKSKPYGKRLKLAKGANGKHIPYRDTTEIFYGRGFVQLTWYENYLKAGKFLGLDLLHDADLALDVNNAAEIMILGMVDGWFTGKKLSDYIGVKNDFVGARRIINGTDRASLIASYAHSFLTCLIKANS
jgi:hypothetical protein